MEFANGVMEKRDAASVEELAEAQDKFNIVLGLEKSGACIDNPTCAHSLCR